MNVKLSTIARTIVLFLALINQICAVKGWIPLDISEDTIYQLCTALATVIASIWAWWKNNSFTESAIEADQFMKKLKSRG